MTDCNMLEKVSCSSFNAAFSITCTEKSLLICSKESVKKRCGKWLSAYGQDISFL